MTSQSCSIFLDSCNPKDTSVPSKNFRKCSLRQYWHAQLERALREIARCQIHKIRGLHPVLSWSLHPINICEDEIWSRKDRSKGRQNYLIDIQYLIDCLGWHTSDRNKISLSFVFSSHQSQNCVLSIFQ